MTSRLRELVVMVCKSTSSEPFFGKAYFLSFSQVIQLLRFLSAFAFRGKDLSFTFFHMLSVFPLLKPSYDAFEKTVRLPPVSCLPDHVSQ